MWSDSSSSDRSCVCVCVCVRRELCVLICLVVMASHLIRGREAPAQSEAEVPGTHHVDDGVLGARVAGWPSLHLREGRVASQQPPPQVFVLLNALTQWHAFDAFIPTTSLPSE